MDEMQQISLTINSEHHSIAVKYEWTLLHIIREVLGFTGTKKGCGKGECGMCTIIMDGKAVDSCLVLGVEADGADILTIEGLAKNGTLHPLQKAFINSDAIQCGFCTPGMIMSAKVLLDAYPDPNDEEIRHGMAGNLCRCTGYEKIKDAIHMAARELRGEK
ncbi:MAG: (2Fe-2S)-binding protein [Candidatus Humimicrobiaceae bacterium]